MIVKNIHNHRRIFAKFCPNTCLALRNNLMAVGVPIDMPVQSNAFSDASGLWLVTFGAFEVVGHEVAQQQLGVVS